LAVSPFSGASFSTRIERSAAEEIAAIELHCALLVAMGCAVPVYAKPAAASPGINAVHCRAGGS
jgi:hypothetical protein